MAKELSMPLHVLHVGNLPVIEEFPVFPAHSGVYVKVFTLSAKKCHHFIGNV